MKKISWISIFLLILACGTSKKIVLDESIDLTFQRVFYKMIYPGQQDANKQMLLILAYDTPVKGMTIDSVYFRGYREKLKAEFKSGEDVFYTQIELMENHQTIAAPFEVSDNEAIITYFDAEQIKHYFKVTGIVEEKPIYMP